MSHQPNNFEVDIFGRSAKGKAIEMILAFMPPYYEDDKQALAKAKERAKIACWRNNQPLTKKFYNAVEWEISFIELSDLTPRKVQNITCCEDCVLFEYFEGKYAFCGAEDAPATEVQDKKVLPEWCPNKNKELTLTWK